MKPFINAMIAVTLAAAPVCAQQVSVVAQKTASIPAYAVIPSYATSSGDLTPSGQWTWTHDTGTPGSSVASSQYPVSNPSLDGKSREIYMSYSGHGGERFSLTFAKDTAATHFIYDTYVYVDDPANLANLELDMNQVMANGKTVIYAFQCSVYSKRWEYSTLSGSKPYWHPSALACNPETWTAYAWHHVQIASHRDSEGQVTYDWVNLDGTYNQLAGATGNGAIALGWAIGDLNLNFQLDGSSEYSSSVKLYQDELTIYRW